ncbi:MAG: hypothetical protein IH855_09660 [Bacteroidetes bacterium]|nr:hypothetical protein [Bacteroidota bacterium]
MTKLLERAFAEASSRPEEEQDAIAAGILSELEDEKGWEERFVATTDKQWDGLAEMARGDIKGEGSVRLDELIRGERG